MEDLWREREEEKKKKYDSIKKDMFSLKNELRNLRDANYELKE